MEEKAKAKVEANRKANVHREKALEERRIPKDVMDVSWNATRLGAAAPPTLPEIVLWQLEKVRAETQ